MKKKANIEFLRFVTVLGWLLVSATTQAFSLAQIDTARQEFFPLHIGDLWQYRNENNQLAIQRIIGDTVIEGKKFFLMIHSLRTFGGGIIRVDSSSRVQILYGNPIGGDSCGGELARERSTYRLAEPESSAWRTCDDFYAFPSNTYLVSFDGIFLRNMFGQVRETMDFSFGGVTNTGDTLLLYSATLGRGIGVFYESYYDSPFFQLYGAIINGVQYGTIVAVDDIPTTAPSSFKLKQNYPNPFNPETTIEYELPLFGYVSLKVYNLLGQEVTVLVDGFRYAGRHQEIFRANSLASGVYSYVLRVGEFAAVRSMILIR